MALSSIALLVLVCPAALAAATTFARGSFIEAGTPFVVSLAIGALVGIERERGRQRSEESTAAAPGGIRTFPLVALLGCSFGWLGERYGLPIVAVGLGAFALLIAVIYVMTAAAGDLGATTEVALFLTFVLGIMTFAGEALLASAVAVAMTVLLSARDRLHDIANKIQAEDLYAALTLAVVTVIVLPVLPDRGFGPYQVWNPYKIWLLVIFISAIGFAGYVGIRMFGPGRGIALAGLLGGLVSSTATTLTFSGRSKEDPALSKSCALAIALAWAAMFGRVIAEVAAVNRSLVREIALPVGGAGVAGVIGAGLLVLYGRRGGKAGTETESEAKKYSNPFSLWSALKFGAIFAAVLLGTKLVQVQFKEAGLLVAAVLTGLLDVDAITLTVARLSERGELPEATAARAVLLAAASNTCTKAFMAISLGAPALRWALIPIAAATLATGALLALVPLR